MEKDHISELLKLFTDFDTEKHWKIEPDEAVQILLNGEEEGLFSNNVEDFVDIKLGEFEAIAHQRGGVYGSTPLSVEKIYDLIRLSPHAQKTYERNYVDLSNATEVELSDGRKIPINQGVPKNDKP